jgi:hypothetical protein
MSSYNSLTQPAINQLAQAIVESAFSCAEQLKPQINEEHFATVKERNDQYVYLVWEYLFFLMHVCSMKAHRRLGGERGLALCNELSPHIIRPMIEMLFGRIAQDVAERLKEDFFEELNRAETLYSECKEIMIRNDLLTDKGVVNLLGQRVGEACGRPSNPIVLTLAQGAGVNGWTNMHLGELIDAVEKEL